ncbi:MAG: alpha/beta fold hydrolase, partial [Candidatus Dormibacteraeota bacterium]|nr:alpha/beta fold hydrolase [Candidatus Dormibacteraeota bacterium]
MREHIEFDAEGVTLRGWFYRPDNTGTEVPCVVMAHGFSAIKEMRLDEYAEVFSDAGLACVVYDNRGFGASDAAPGKPRQEIDPWEQIRDYQHAITYAQSRPEVDANRIGVWGSSYSAGHSYVVAAIDRRVKAVCGQVPLISGRRAFEMLVRLDFWEQTWQQLAADRLARARGEAPGMLPVVDPDPTAQSALPTPDSYQFFSAYEGTSWKNEVTLRTIEMFQGYEPGEYLKR